METNQSFDRQEYASKDFWNNRFSEYKSAFDWYVGWDELRKTILTNFPSSTTDNVLMVGCGNSSKNYSELSQQLEKSNYLVTNIDISDVVIEQMIQKSKQDYILMDATKMNFRDRSFDFTIDKGTFDALACDTGSDLPKKLVSELGRVSNKGLLIVTHGKPSNRSAIFLNALSVHGQWDEVYFECELSFQSQFINVIRSKYPGVSISSVMKNPSMLVECFQEAKASRGKKESSNNSTRQTHCWVYIYKRIV